MLEVNKLDLFFVFKQKTAYEMRISDWSSDVCSSDLQAAADGTRGAIRVDLPHRRPRLGPRPRRRHEPDQVLHARTADGRQPRRDRHAGYLEPEEVRPPRHHHELRRRQPLRVFRSEEHTSETQSLMRLSFDGFCMQQHNNHVVTSKS